MKITKFIHSCLLVEMPAPVNRTVLFDPGSFSTDALNNHSLKYLDDIFITHEHFDHVNIKLIKKLIQQFPEVKITAGNAVVLQLKEHGIESSSLAPEEVTFFEAPHEGNPPFLEPPENTGFHYLDLLTHPGDSHSFTETKQTLALPVTAPWGSTDRAVQLALQLRPKYIIPIHDWHWKDEVREQIYEKLEKIFEDEGIKFFRMETGEPIVLDL